jgi:hypothetical protein
VVGALPMMVMRSHTTDSFWPLSHNPLAKYNHRDRKDSDLDLPRSRRPSAPLTQSLTPPCRGRRITAMFPLGMKQPAIASGVRVADTRRS